MNDLAKTAEVWGVEAGYHDIFGSWHTAGPQTLSRLIAALSRGREGPAHTATWSAEPLRAFQGDGRRGWGLAVQLYSVRSARNWGHGDFSDLRRLVAIAMRCGAMGIGLNPLHALFADRAEQASPYAPNSRLFLNPLYIDVEAIPEFPGVTAAGLEAELNALRATDMVAYARVARAKLAGLRLAYDRFRVGASAQRRADFEAFRQEQGEALLRFACFEVLRQCHAPKPWPQWPHPVRHPDTDALQDFRRTHSHTCEFHEFMQWVADQQLQACHDEAGGSVFRSDSISISPSGSTRTALMPGAIRTLCLPTFQSARHPTNSIQRARTGASPPSIRMRCPPTTSRPCAG